jgi:ABC-2 type transport system ATP-binding protein
MQEVSAICQRAVIIHRGSIVADKPVAELGSSLQGNPVLRIRFMERYNLGWLKNQQGVLSLRHEEENVVLVEFREAESDQTRAAIFTEAASRKQIITEMEKTEASLEQVFQQLTK